MQFIGWSKIGFLLIKYQFLNCLLQCNTRKKQKKDLIKVFFR